MLKRDHTGLPFSLAHFPDRIVCLVPSITELLFDLGLGDKVVGRTKFCFFPNNGFPKSKIIGGTKQVHIDIIKELEPDLLIANKEENVQEQVIALREFTSVFTTVVKDTKDALEMIKDIGTITGTLEKAKSICDQFSQRMTNFKATKNLRMAYLIWRKPYMTIGGDTFISAFMENFGFTNCFKDQLRYPEITINDLKQKKPDIILLSSEPYPFDENHKKEILAKTGINTTLIDGSICSWYGSRMLMAKDFFETFTQQIRDEMSLNDE